jgi:hypothetical protein
MPEAYLVHRAVIEWHARYSADRIPDQALGIDRITAMVMRFALKSWARVQFLNRFLAGTWAPRIQMDLVPAIACGAHYLVLAEDPPTSIDDYVDAGRAVQRFWLTVTRLGLLMQPSMTPLIFARYERERRSFSTAPAIARQSATHAERLSELFGSDAVSRAVFMGRIGAGRPTSARSLRREVRELLVRSP